MWKKVFEITIKAFQMRKRVFEITIKVFRIAVIVIPIALVLLCAVPPHYGWKWGGKRLVYGAGRLGRELVYATWNSGLLRYYELLQVYRYLIWWGFALTALIAVVVFTRKRLWKEPILNALTIRLMSIYLRVDKRARLYHFGRHIAYLLRKRIAWLLMNIHTVFRRFKLNLHVRIVNTEIKPSERFLLVLSALIDEYASRAKHWVIDLEIMKRSMRINSPEKRLRIRPNAIIGTCDLLLQTCAEHLNPPYYRGRSGKDYRFQAAMVYDELYLCRALLVHLLANSETSRIWQRPPQQKTAEKWKRRAVSIYEDLRHTERLRPVEQEFIAFRLTILAHEPEKIQRYQWDLFGDSFCRLISAYQSEPLVQDEPFIQQATSAWTTLLGLHLDWHGIIQTYNWLQEKTTVPLSDDDFIRLGNAWWEYAKTLGNNDFGQFAWQNAIEGFFQAKSTKHLRDLAQPFRLD